MTCPFCNTPDIEQGYHLCPKLSTERVNVVFHPMDDEVAKELAEKQRAGDR